jgi:hypothetical protein
MDIVDQYYWLAYAKKQVDNAAQNLNDAAGKISTLVATFWTLYTTAFAIGAGIKKLDESAGIIVLLVLPIPLLIFSYMSALWAQMPEMTLKGVDPRVPAQVMNYYTETIINKRRRLWASLVIFFAAGLSLTFALTYANFTHERKDTKQLIAVIPTGDKLLVSGDLPSKTVVRLTIKSGTTVLSEVLTQVTQNDHFDRTLPVPQKTAYTLTVDWREPGDTTISHSYLKLFPLAKK